MEVATAASSTFALHSRMLSPSASARAVNRNRSLKASLTTSFPSPFASSSSGSAEFSGHTLRPEPLNPASLSRSKPKRSVVTNLNAYVKINATVEDEMKLDYMQNRVIPFTRGSAWEQPPPDLASYLFKNRIVYLGMPLVPSVTELMMAEFLYLQYEDEQKPIYMYINSTGTQKGGQKLGYETEAFAVYDSMSYVKAPIFTLCVGNAWGEAAMLLAAGAKGNRSALPSSTIMIRQPIARFQGQATDVDLARKELRNVKIELIKLMARHTGKSPEEIEADTRRPKYFTPSEAVEYGIIDKVLYNEKSTKDRGVVSDLKKAQLI